MITIKSKKQNGKVVRYNVEANSMVYGVELLRDLETCLNICPVPKKINDAQICVLNILREYKMIGDNRDCILEPVLGEHNVVIEMCINI